MDDSVICLGDVEMPSPNVTAGYDESGASTCSRLEQHKKEQKYQPEDVEMVSPRYSLLESVTARFEQQRKEQEDRVRVMRTKREVEVAHSKYLRKSVVEAEKMAEAKFVVDAWAHKHGRVERMAKRLSGDKKLFPQKKRNQSRVLSPSYKNKMQTSGVKNNQSVSQTVSTNQADSDCIMLLSEEESFTTSSPARTGGAGYRERIPSCVILDNTPRTVKSGTTSTSKSPHLVLEDGIEEYNEQITCCILGCGAVFSSKAAKNAHDERFSHSPCNPLLLNINCEMMEEKKYLCPKCSKIFKSLNGCKSHMEDLQHLPFLSPLLFGGYMCVQCLSIFKTHLDCSNHMTLLNHKKVVYPFRDDLKRDPSVEPVPVSAKFVKEFCGICEAVTFEVQCVDCGIRINSALQLRRHQTETHNSHCISTSAASTQVEVFAMFLSSHYCEKCKCLCDKSTTSQKHKCSKTHSGDIVDLNCKSFSEFIVMCGIRCELNAPVSSSDSDNDDDDDDYDDNVACSEVLNKRKRKRKKKRRVAESEITDEKRICGISENFKEMTSASTVVKQSSSEELQTQFKNILEFNERKNLPDSKMYNCSNTGLLGKTVDNCTVSLHGCESKDIHTTAQSSLPLTAQSFLSLTDPSYLIQMKNIVLLDLDNWPKFFQKLTDFLPDKTFVWAFYGGSTVWKEPTCCPPFDYQKKNGRFHLHDRCGRSKDAADVAICITVGKLDVSLPKNISFTILSGDKGFHEVERQLRNSERKAVVIDPHDAQKFSPDMISSMVASVSDK